MADRDKKGRFIKGHSSYGGEAGWFKKGRIPWNKEGYIPLVCVRKKRKKRNKYSYAEGARKRWSQA